MALHSFLCGLGAAALLMPAVWAQSFPAACNLIQSETLRRTGREEIRVGRFSAAAKAFQDALEACPSQHGLLLELSDADLRQKDFAGAVNAALRYVELDPSSIDGRLVLANAYFQSQKMPDALREVDAALKQDPYQITALKLKGNIEYLTGHVDEALAALQTVIERYPQDEDGAYMLGRMYYQEKRVDHAAGQFQRVLKLNPKSYKAYDNLGLCYQSLGDMELAKRYFLTAIKLVDQDHPEYEWPYSNLGSLLLDQGDAEKAFGFLSKAADRNPYSARTFYLGGKALNKLGKLDLCANWLERSVALDPHYPEPLYLLARTYSQLGQDEKAKAAMDKFKVVKATAPRERK